MSEAQQNGVYTYEVARKLTTGSKFDVHFSDTNKTYYFGVAAFDNAQVGMRCRMKYRSSKRQTARSPAGQRYSSRLAS